jgi:hypothetical protein
MLSTLTAQSSVQSTPRAFSFGSAVGRFLAPWAAVSAPARLSLDQRVCIGYNAILEGRGEQVAKVRKDRRKVYVGWLADGSLNVSNTCISL